MTKPLYTLDVRKADLLDPALQHQWQHLQQRLCAVSPFLRWNWISTWLKVIPAPDAPNVFVLSDEQSVQAIALVGERIRPGDRLLGTQQLHLNSTGLAHLDFPYVEHNDILASSESALSELLQHLVQRRRVAEILIPGVSRSTFAQSVKAVAQRFNCQSMVRSTSPYFIIDLDELRAKGGTYIDALSSNTRAQVRKAIRETSKLGEISISAASGPEEALRYLSELMSLHQRYWSQRKQVGAFGTPARRSFHMNFVESGIVANEVEILKICAGPTPLGYLYNLVSGRCVYSYQSGFNYDQPRLKPGLVCHSVAAERYLRGDFSSYDLLAGDSQYKRSLSTGSGEMRWLSITRGSPRARAAKLVELFERLLLKVLPD